MPANDKLYLPFICSPCKSVFIIFPSLLKIDNCNFIFLSKENWMMEFSVTGLGKTSNSKSLEKISWVEEIVSELNPTKVTMFPEWGIAKVSISLA